jgi:hypothetical protein
MNQSIEDASRNSIIEDAKAAFGSENAPNEFALECLVRFAKLREARQSSQSEPVARYEADKSSYGFRKLSDKLKNGDLLYLAAPQQAIPSGYALVPLIPTDAMLRPFVECEEKDLILAYRTMLIINGKSELSASPTAPIESDK